MSLKFWKGCLPSAIVNWTMLVNIEKARSTGEAKKKNGFWRLNPEFEFDEGEGPISEKNDQNGLDKSRKFECLGLGTGILVYFTGS